ncbi:unnamed protein product [Arctogadus glacialis]
MSCKERMQIWLNLVLNSTTLTLRSLFNCLQRSKQPNLTAKVKGCLQKVNEYTDMAANEGGTARQHKVA